MQAQGKFSRNFIIGVSFLIALVLLYFGVNFLKGTNILKKQNTYVVMFDDVTG
ncbi:MAG TPA: MCE family protein, partial [Porphyromonadaceae bacterium]|nr:MCE family protein [Porphyromonadaceae bacterium]